MFIKWKRQRATAWMMVVAVVLSSLLPLRFHGVQRDAAPYSFLHHINTSGHHAASVPGDGGQVTSGSAQHGVHGTDCPYCRPHDDAPGLLPSIGFIPLTAGDGQSRPALFLRSARPRFTWEPAIARAPPGLS